MIYMGIDPGRNGGMAVIYPDGEVGFKSMPEDEADVWKWISNYSGIAVAFVEQVRGHIGKSHPGSSMFNFGWSYGGLRMALTAAGIPFRAVPPQEWQGSLAIERRTELESDTSWKNRLRAEASRIFRKYRVTLRTADALLIAHYCRQYHQERE